MADLDVTARPVLAVIPTKAIDRRQLKSNLAMMGLKELLRFPWRLYEFSLIDEGIWDAKEGIGVCARPSTWTESLIAGVYLTPTTGVDL